MLTGAGVSAESGIETFRASDGLWENHPVEDVATPEGYERNPELVQSFYNQRRAQLAQVQPNEAHISLARFEEEFKGDFLLITQNVDDLHERAGSNNLIHMHGELQKVRCQNTGQLFPWYQDVTLNTQCSCCSQSGTLRPHIVWFGEIPLEMERINDALAVCDLFVAIGTSGKVYPAAGFCQEARLSGARTVELNLEASSNYSDFDVVIGGLATDIVPTFLMDISP